jgi:RNA polymerase sigma-B factor
LINAVNRFDADRGVPFVGYAIPTIQGGLRRYFRDRTWSARVPRRLKDLHVRISAATPRLIQQLGRAPRPSELAAHLDLPLENVLESLQASSTHTANSLEQMLDTDSDDGGSFGEVLGEHDPDFERVEIHECLTPLLASLSRRERVVLSLRFAGNRTQYQIAAEIGVSQMHVSGC